MTGYRSANNNQPLFVTDFQAPGNAPILLQTQHGLVLADRSSMARVSNTISGSNVAGIGCSACAIGAGGRGVPGNLTRSRVWPYNLQEYGRGFFSRAIGGLRVWLTPR